MENKLAEHIVRLEWEQFQLTANEGGRAQCQDNWPTFHQMRLSQFLSWPQNLLSSYENDLEDANRVGRNLVAEKYGRMMSSTAPDDYARNIEPYIDTLSGERIRRQEEVISVQVAWARDFAERYPKLGKAMRALTTDEDGDQATSFETYLRGELGTYSTTTFDLYARFISRLSGQNRNLTEDIIANTVTLAGYEGLAQAEALQ